MRQFRIAPSILSANFAELGHEISRVEAAGADWIHFDAMDNHYVPNLTIGPGVCAAIRPVTKLPIDVHLMCKPVDGLIPMFAKAGADIISIHPEATEHPHRSLSLIRELGCRAGLVLNPGTSLTVLDHLMDAVDLVLLMSVNPGFGGQAFIPETLNKARIVRGKIDAYARHHDRSIYLEVDGGVKVDNIGALAESGIDTFVAGSAIFGAASPGGGYHDVITAMRHAIQAPESIRQNP